MANETNFPPLDLSKLCSAPANTNKLRTHFICRRIGNIVRLKNPTGVSIWFLHAHTSSVESDDAAGDPHATQSGLESQHKQDNNMNKMHMHSQSNPQQGILMVGFSQVTTWNSQKKTYGLRAQMVCSPIYSDPCYTCYLRKGTLKATSVRANNLTEIQTGVTLLSQG